MIMKSVQGNRMCVFGKRRFEDWKCILLQENESDFAVMPYFGNAKNKGQTKMIRSCRKYRERHFMLHGQSWLRLNRFIYSFQKMKLNRVLMPH